MNRKLLLVLAAAAASLLVAGAARANAPTFFTTEIHRDLSPLPAAPAGPCAFPVGRHVDLGIREIFFSDQSGNVVRQIILTPGSTETFTNLSNGNTATLQAPASQHYTINPDGSIDIATTGLVFVVTGKGGQLAINAGRHVIHLVPTYDDQGNLVGFDVTSVSDAGPNDQLFPALCAALS